MKVSRIKVTITDDAALLSKLHTACFDKGWSITSIEALLKNPHTKAMVDKSATPHGLIIWREVQGEIEIIEIGVLPNHRGQGFGLALMKACLKRQPPKTRCFLEVQHDNHAAIALYKKLGFETVSTRSEYYAQADGPRADAMVMQKDLP